MTTKINLSYTEVMQALQQFIVARTHYVRETDKESPTVKLATVRHDITSPSPMFEIEIEVENFTGWRVGVLPDVVTDTEHEATLAEGVMQGLSVAIERVEEIRDQRLKVNGDAHEAGVLLDVVNALLRIRNGKQLLPWEGFDRERRGMLQATNDILRMVEARHDQTPNHRNELIAAFFEIITQVEEYRARLLSDTNALPKTTSAYGLHVYRPGGPLTRATHECPACGIRFLCHAHESAVKIEVAQPQSYGDKYLRERVASLQPPAQELAHNPNAPIAKAHTDADGRVAFRSISEQIDEQDKRDYPVLSAPALKFGDGAPDGLTARDLIAINLFPAVYSEAKKPMSALLSSMDRAEACWREVDALLATRETTRKKASNG